MSDLRIPKIIHYCWFGGNDKPELVRKCIKSYELLDDYQIIEWNEANYDVSSHPFTSRLYEAGGYAYVADYVRLKALHDFGGIYVDTDVEIKKDFAACFLESSFFIPFSYDCALSTAVIGSEAGNPIVARLMKNYDNDFIDYHINNYMVTKYFVDTFPEFKLNNQFQVVHPGVAVYPKEYFDCPTGDPTMGYSVHHALGSWRDSYFKTPILNHSFR